MILIFSPQNWSHQFISKHHYAIAFSKKKKTYFFEPITLKWGKFQYNTLNPYPENKNLSVVQIVLPFKGFTRFKAEWILKRFNAMAIKRWIKKSKQQPELIIDFGCHTSITNWSFMECEKKVYFPVDDFENLPIEKRGCNAFFSVSSNIQEKFNAAGIPMKFMHHGLNHWFAEKAEQRLKMIENGNYNRTNKTINIAYSGNLTIPFLDRELVSQLVANYKDCQFHFFGKNDSTDARYQEWFNRLKSFSNVHLYGQISVEELAEHLFEMDMMLLCYKPDNKNYHAENSHKINEYLSTGMPLLTTPISVLDNKNFYYLLDATNEDVTMNSFQAAKDEIKEGSVEKMRERIKHALGFGYDILVKTKFNI